MLRQLLYPKLLKFIIGFQVIFSASSPVGLSEMEMRIYL